MTGAKHGFRRKQFLAATVCLLLLVAFVSQCRSIEHGQSPGKVSLIEREDNHMSEENMLENMIAGGDWKAVELAVRMGDAAWPAVKKGATMEGFQSRQIAMVCAGQLGGKTAGEILLAGLADKHINVSLAAAGQLAKNPPAGSHQGILQELSSCSEENICALLALAAGRLSGKAPIQTLLGLVEGDDDVAQNARLALAKLGQKEYLEEHLAKLASESPHIRYTALAQLIYIDDPKLAENVKTLLGDKEVAITLGTQYNPRYRRVCDQAVETLKALLKFTVPFETSAGTIYSDEQLRLVKEKVK